MKFKRIFSLVLVLLFCLITGCSGDNSEKIVLPKGYKLPKEMRTVKSGIVAENENTELSWDVDKGCVLLKNKNTGVIWSTTPYEFYSKNETANKYVADGICSVIRVTYIDKKNNNEIELNSNSDANFTLAAKLKNGIKIIYYFDKVGISVPVLFVLEGNGVSVSVDISNITEKENKVYKVSLLPFFASAKNDDNTYLFVPSGSGALMYTDDNYRTPRLYSEPVFGEDLVEQSIYKISDTEKVRLPVFGAKNKENALFAVITAAADIAEISGNAGDPQYGYSGAYASFYLRGKTESNLKGQANSNSKLIKYSEGLVSQKRATVRYIMLDSQNSDYNGMVKAYREYLAENEGLKTDIASPDTVLTIFGGATQRKLFLGVPYNSFYAMTTLKQAKTILADINKNTEASMAVNFKGFGVDGLDNTVIAGDFKPEKALGNKKELKEFMNWCKSESIDAFYDFDMISMKKSSNDYSKRDSAITPSGVRAKAYEYTTVIREQDKTSYRYLNSRYGIASSANNIIVAAMDLGLNGIGFSSLTSTAYSDYSSADYYCKANMSVDVNRILEISKKQGFKTIGESANSYAATKLDYIFNSPTTSSKYNSLDKDIPFYQMVLRGATGLTGSIINLSASPETEFLNTVSLGCSLGFTVCNQTDLSFVRGGQSAASLSVYEGLSQEMTECINSAKPLLQILGSAKIVSYERKNELSTTVFENGVTVCVNYGETPIKTSYGTVEARSFIYN